MKHMKSTNGFHSHENIGAVKTSGYKSVVQYLSREGFGIHLANLSRYNCHEDTSKPIAIAS